MSEERRRTQKRLGVLRGILYTILGFSCILVFAILPPTNRIGLNVLPVLYVCTLGVTLCCYALKEFLSAYKDKDVLLSVIIMADFHIGHYQGVSSMDSYIERSYCRRFHSQEKDYTQNDIR